MCFDNNNSSLSVHYINAQLTALWENAQKCAEFLHPDSATVDIRSAHFEKSRYTRALREFYYFGDNPRRQRNSPLEFRATFAKPQIGFICNHDAMLLLDVEAATLNMSGASGQGRDVQSTQTSTIKNTKVAFRIKFHRRRLSGRDPLIGNIDGKHSIQFIILQLDPCPEVTSIEGENLGDVNRKALEDYLKAYLKLLRLAGNHVLFDLPDFDDDKHRPTIDYSLDGSTDLPKSILDGYEASIHSVKVSEINKDLSLKWARAMREAITGNSSVYETCLAWVNSTLLHGTSFGKHFFIQFREPQVDALCSHEIVFNIRVESVWFFDSEDFSQPNCGHFKDWTFGFIIDVSEKMMDNNAIIELELDFHKVRFSRVRSQAPKDGEELFMLLSRFFSANYFDMLRSRALQSLHRIDLRIDVNVGLDDMGDEGESDDEEGSSWRYDREAHAHRSGQYVPDFGLGINVNVQVNTSNSSTFGLDNIVSVPEEAINDMYSSLYERARTVRAVDRDHELYHWKSQSATCNMKVRGLVVRLLSGGQYEGKAIVLVKIENGTIATKRTSEAENTTPWSQTSWQDWEPSEGEDSETHSFGEIMFAYKVDLTLIDNTDEALKKTDFHKRFESSSIRKVFSDTSVSHSFKHVVLEMRRSEFVPELSQTSSLGQSIDGVIRLELMQKYIHQYLEHLVDRGDHVLRSLPVLMGYDKSWSYDIREKVSYAMTSHKFRVIAKESINPHNCLHKRDPADSPALLIFGMCHGHDMPRLLSPTATGWVPPSGNRQTRPCGTVYIGKNILLEGRLLDIFELFNRKTTLVDKGFRRGDFGWGVNLDKDVVLWTEDSSREHIPCPWTQVTGASSTDRRSLKYVWRYGDKLFHERRGTGTVKNRKYSISYNTENTLDIPTSYASHGVIIVLEGHSTLSVEETDDQRSFRRKTEASWKISVEIISGADGIDVELPQFPEIQLEETEAVGDCEIDIKSAHRAFFDGVDFSAIKERLVNILCGEWKYMSSSRHRYTLAQPAFAQDGAFVARLIQMRVDATSTSRRTNGATRDHSSFVIDDHSMQSATHHNGDGITKPPSNGSIRLNKSQDGFSGGITTNVTMTSSEQLAI